MCINFLARYKTGCNLTLLDQNCEGSIGGRVYAMVSFLSYIYEKFSIILSILLGFSFYILVERKALKMWNTIFL